MKAYKSAPAAQFLQGGTGHLHFGRRFGAAPQHDVPSHLDEWQGQFAHLAEGTDRARGCELKLLAVSVCVSDSLRSVAYDANGQREFSDCRGKVVALFACGFQQRHGELRSRDGQRQARKPGAAPDIHHTFAVVEQSTLKSLQRVLDMLDPRPAGSRTAVRFNC